MNRTNLFFKYNKISILKITSFSIRLFHYYETFD